MVNLTKTDLKEALKGVAKAKDLEDLAGDVVRVEGKVDGLVRDMKERPTRGDFPELLKTALDFVTLKAEHDRIKKIIREELNVEV